MTTEALLPSEEVIETCSILTNLSSKYTPKIIDGKEVRQTFQNYKFENIQKHLSYINKRGAIKITTEVKSSDLKLPNILSVEVNHDAMNSFMKILASQIQGRKTDP
jgi:hypothetical protein